MPVSNISADFFGFLPAAVFGIQMKVYGDGEQEKCR
jgi:hypothetical protein